MTVWPLLPKPTMYPTAWIIRKAVRDNLDCNGHSAVPTRSHRESEGIGSGRVEDGGTR